MPSHNLTYDFATARFNAVFHNRLRFMLNVCLTIIICLKWDVRSQNAPHVSACFCGWQRDRWGFFVQCPLHSSLRSRRLKVAGERENGSARGRHVSPYVFMSSLLYLNRKNFIKIPSSLSCCRFWLIIRITINIIYLIVTVIPVNEFLLHLGQTSPVKYV